MTDTVVELEGVNGELFNLTTGDRGISLGTDVKGLYDPPVKVVYEEPGNYPGARYLSHRILRRDITFGAEILNDKRAGSARSWLSRDSEWRKAWAFDRDSKLHITTPESGTRYLKCRLGESPDISLYTDPNGRSVNRAVMTVISGDPFWYENDVVYSVVTKKDTRFDPSSVSAWASLPKETLTIKVDPSDGRGGLNPTDQYIFLKWTLPASLSANSSILAQSPFAQYTIPDFSFEDPAYTNRVVRTPGLIKGEDCVIDTDPRVEQFTAANGAPVWSRTNGVRFRNPVPPWTEGREFPIQVTGLPAGQMITLRLPRPWSRPWGLE